MLSPLFCRANVACVLITMKEPIGTAGRGGYFDAHGIVRDILQNHLLQVMALLAMERPVSLAPDDVRDEKHKLLRCVQPVRPC
jgi:glucose-6-phosphate 1-dehydrogenase